MLVACLLIAIPRLARAQVSASPGGDGRYPAAAPETMATPPPGDPALLRARIRAAEDAEIARRQARRDAARSEREREAAHQRQPRPVLSIGLGQARVGRDLPGSGYIGRARQTAVELGVAYTQHFARVIGARMGVSVLLGFNRLSVSSSDLSIDCCAPVHDPGTSFAYGFAVDAAPVISAGNTGFYVAPGAVARLFVLTRSRAVIDTGDAYAANGPVVDFSLRSPLLALGVRLGLGYRLGKHREYDVGVALDGGPAFRDADRYFGALVRLSVAFTDIQTSPTARWNRSSPVFQMSRKKLVRFSRAASF